MPDRANKDDRRSRYDEYSAFNSPLADLPPVTATYLLADWQAVGMCSSGMNGPVPLSWQEIQAYSQMTATPFTPWEAETIRTMSRRYCSKFYESRHESTPPPYVDESPEAMEQRKKAETAQIKAMFRGAR